MDRIIALRPVTRQDEAFLYNLYKLSRVEEFSVLNLSEVQFDLLMRMQYTTRKAAYESSYPDGQHDIVLVDRVESGQIRISRDHTQVRLVDISIAKEFQNQGIGAAIVKDLISEAQAAGLPLRCSVATNNPGSLRFHQHLGFQITSQDEMYYQLEKA